MLPARIAGATFWSNKSHGKLNGIIATDDRDGDLINSVKISHEINNRKYGTYEIKYEVSDKAGNYSASSYTTVVSQQNTSGTTTCAMLADGPFNIYYARYGYHQFDNQSISITAFSATGNTNADTGYTNTRTITLSISATASYYQITDIHNSVSDIVYTKSSTKPTSITLPDTQGSHKLTLTVFLTPILSLSIFVQ